MNWYAWIMLRAMMCFAAVLIGTVGVAHASEGYVRFCTQHIGAPGSLKEDADDRRELQKTAAQLSEDGVLSASAAAMLHLAHPPAVVARNAQNFGHPRGPELVLLSDLDPISPHWWQATLRADSSIASIAVASPQNLRGPIGYVRGMAAYIVFNDLMGGDAVFPRSGCAALFDLWFGFEPTVNQDLKAAVATEPAQDPVLAASVRDSWNAFVANPKTLGYAIMRDTMDSVGKNPPVTLVYRDVGLPGDGFGEFDVVRIGGEHHTYSIIHNGLVKFDGGPLCIVGDDRCGEFYVWP